MGPGIEDLKELSRGLKVDGSTVGEALEGLSLQSAMKSKGITDPKKVEIILNAASVVTRDSTIDIPNLLDSARRMVENESKEDRTYEEQEAYYSELVSSSQKLEENLVVSEGKVSALKPAKVLP